MRIILEFETTGSAFQDNPSLELRHILDQADRKIGMQFTRSTRGVVCTAPESADKLLDSNGNTIGSVLVKES